jgi:multisubunit Na+/H+ antiporter MnhB subunit
MRIALAVYIVVFGAAGAWSVIPDDPRTPLLERIAEAVSFLVLCFGMIMFLLGRPAPGGRGLWLGVTFAACAAELLVVVIDRRRTMREELVKAEDVVGMQRLVRINDLAMAAFFLPAVSVNVAYAFKQGFLA